MGMNHLRLLSCALAAVALTNPNPGQWNAVFAMEPSVKNAPELLRIDDLEDRHRPTFHPSE
jgi:hypothetical protein